VLRREIAGKHPIRESFPACKVSEVMWSSFPSTLAFLVLVIGLGGTTRADQAAVCRARRQPSYQVFAAQARLPEIRALDNGAFTVGGTLTLDLHKSNQSTTSEKRALAQLLQVPPGLLTAVLHKLSTTESSSEELARQFQTAVVDYRYLAQRWAEYRPPASGEAVKAEAMKCLETGDLEKAWQMYIDLPKPSPPTHIRVANVGPGRN
jgi:hypothetical protein